MMRIVLHLFFITCICIVCRSNGFHKLKIASYERNTCRVKVLSLHATNDKSSAFVGALTGRVACVTGATRGIGRGIALGLAEQGATVFVTGRSLDDKSITEADLGGTLNGLVEEINALGGEGIAVKVDHSIDSEVETLFQIIDKQKGRLDLLVNNAFQVPSPPDGSTDRNLLFRNYWEQPGWFWDQFINVGLRSHYIASCYAHDLMQRTETSFYSKENKKNGQYPLIAHISSFGGVSYSFNVAYGVGKAGVDRLARDMQIELQRNGSMIRSVAVYPGIVRTERMRDILDSGEWEARSSFATPVRFVEAPMLTGRALAALFTNNDGHLDEVAGKVCVVAELAKRYNILDPVSGITPPSIRSLKFLIPSIILSKLNEKQRQNLEDMIISLSPDVLLPMSVMAEPPP